jgi:hypothetical protein
MEGFMMFPTTLLGSGVVLALLAQGPSPAAFAEARLAASLRGDTAAYRRLLHPAVQACLGPESGIYLRFLLRHDPTMPAKAPVAQAELKPVPGPIPPGADSLTPFPVPPTHLLSVTYRVDSTDTRSIGAQLVRYRDSWVEVIGCPTKGGLAAIAARLAAFDRRWDDATTSRAGLPPALATEAAGLIRAGRLVDAIGLLNRTGGLPLEVARDVAHLIKADPGRA